MIQLRMKNDFSKTSKSTAVNKKKTTRKIRRYRRVCEDKVPRRRKKRQKSEGSKGKGASPHPRRMGTRASTHSI